MNSTNVRCSIYQSLLGANLSALNPAQALPEYTGNLEDFVSAIVNFAQGFAAADVNAPVVFDFETQGYDTLFGANSSPGFLAITANRDIYLQSVGPNLNALQNLSTTYAWIENTYQIYGYTGDTQLTTNQTQLDNDINGLNAWLNGSSGVASNPN